MHSDLEQAERDDVMFKFKSGQYDVCLLYTSECPPGQSDYQYAKNSLMLTQRWLDRCIKRYG